MIVYIDYFVYVKISLSHFFVVTQTLLFLVLFVYHLRLTFIFIFMFIIIDSKYRLGTETTCFHIPELGTRLHIYLLHNTSSPSHFAFSLILASLLLFIHHLSFSFSSSLYLSVFSPSSLLFSLCTFSLSLLPSLLSYSLLATHSYSLLTTLSYSFLTTHFYSVPTSHLPFSLSLTVSPTPFSPSLLLLSHHLSYSFLTTHSYSLLAHSLLLSSHHLSYSFLTITPPLFSPYHRARSAASRWPSISALQLVRRRVCHSEIFR